ncbi:Protein of unknown function [Pyronema omphalodes CBS 100304]|uniref:Uncharacterized protein n=1 Tax=Pyronema omphalodes (strain CBS 100304) TaxID=1076935 RepID=U4LKI5_PYROM|nr:Protein of unknown function [Pyronema omphalodes CBS 100304]
MARDARGNKAAGSQTSESCVVGSTPIGDRRRSARVTSLRVITAAVTRAKEVQPQPERDTYSSRSNSQLLLLDLEKIRQNGKDIGVSPIHGTRDGTEPNNWSLVLSTTLAAAKGRLKGLFELAYWDLRRCCFNSQQGVMQL